MRITAASRYTSSSPATATTMPSTSRHAATESGYEMHQTSSSGPPSMRNSRQARKLERREAEVAAAPRGRTGARRAGRAGDIETRPRYHSGSPHHEVPTSTTTATAQTHSTAGEIGHEAQPVQRHAQPLELTDSVGRAPRRTPGARSASVLILSGRATSLRWPPLQMSVKVFARRVVAQPRCVSNHSSARCQASVADASW